MSKYKKIFLNICIAFILFFLSADWLLQRMLMANITKTVITEKLEKLTGYHVVMSGDLAWHYSLHPNLYIDKIVFISDTSRDTIRFNHLSLSIQLLPLWHKLFSIHFSFQDWQQNQLHFSTGSGHIEFQNKILVLSNFHSKFYQGMIHGSAQINLHGTIPRFDITVNVTQIEIADLLADLTHTVSIAGKVDASAILLSQGSNAEDFISNLHGRLSLLVNKGKLPTIPLHELLPQMILSKRATNIFDTFKIDATIVRGIANSIMQLAAKNYHITGTGEINLMQQTLNLHLDTYYIRSKKIKNIAIPSTISGPIAAPKIRIDTTLSLQQLLATQGESVVKKINQLLKKI